MFLKLAKKNGYEAAEAFKTSDMEDKTIDSEMKKKIDEIKNQYAKKESQQPYYQSPKKGMGYPRQQGNYNTGFYNQPNQMQMGMFQQQQQPAIQQEQQPAFQQQNMMPGFQQQDGWLYREALGRKAMPTTAWKASGRECLLSGPGSPSTRVSRPARPAKASATGRATPPAQ